MAIKLTPGGSNDDAGYRITSASPLGSFTDISISCWIYIDTLPAAGAGMRLLHKKIPASSDDWLLMLNDFASTGNSQISGRIDSSVPAQLQGTTNLSVGQWYHVAMTFNDSGDTLKLFLNGSQDAINSSMTFVIPNVSNTEFWIGYRGVYAAEVFNGKICEVAVWASTLSANQVWMLSKGISPIHINGSALRGYWPLYSDITTNPDYSGNMNSVTKFTEGTATVVQANHAPVRPPFGFDMGWMGAIGGGTKFPVPHLWWSEA